MGAIHGFASSIGGYFPVPHGVVCGTLIAIANKMNIERLVETEKHSDILQKYIGLGSLLDKSTDKKDSYYFDVFINTLEKWLDIFKVPLLSQYGISNGDISKIVAATGQKNNPVSFTDEELGELLSKRI